MILLYNTSKYINTTNGYYLSDNKYVTIRYVGKYTITNSDNIITYSDYNNLSGNRVKLFIFTSIKKYFL